MLRSLYISSFVIIDEVQIDFHHGLSALTGETGAGKSIIIDAIGQLLGNRTQASFVKKGAEKAFIEGIFEINNQEFIDACKDLHIDVEDEVVISKEIYSNGKSNIKINYRNASLSALKLIMPYLVDVHSQFETQSLFSLKKHIGILDQYADSSIQELKQNYIAHYNNYNELQKKLDKVINEELNDEQVEYYLSQINEIDEVQFSDEEVEEFEIELNRLENFEKINEIISSFDNHMSNQCLNSLKDALYDLSTIKDEVFEDYYDNLYNQYYDLKDTYESIMKLYNSFHFDEYRFNELQDNLFKINRLKRKYGYSMTNIQKKKNEILSKIEIIDHRDEYVQKLKNEIQVEKKIALELANQISVFRKETAKKFEEKVINELRDLYLPHANFKVDFKKVEMYKEGIDQVTLMIATNKGQDLSPLNETASGGEISRVMLAIKTIILKNSYIDTIIFDEVDTGVSGKVASGIGEKMRKLGKYKQVICITHLPQVAACATYQYAIEKETEENNTVSSIRLLDKEGRIEELAKMLSGDHISDEARKNAQKLLDV